MNIDLKTISSFGNNFFEFLKSKSFWIFVIIIVTVFLSQYLWFFQIERDIQVNVSLPTSNGQNIDVETMERIIKSTTTSSSTAKIEYQFQRDPFIVGSANPSNKSNSGNTTTSKPKINATSSKDIPIGSDRPKVDFVD